MSHEMTYRRLIFDVAAHGEWEELMPAVLTTMGAVETPFIGGTGIMIIDIDEKEMQLEEIPNVPLIANGDLGEIYEFPPTFQSTELEEDDGTE